MDLQQYVTDATKTESQIDQLIIDPNFFAGIVQIIIAASNMLDQIKKNAFYGKEFNQDQLKMEMVNIIQSLDQIKPSITDQQIGVEVDYDTRVFHSIVGLATESSELLELLVSEDFDYVNFLEELGDVNWYQAIGIDAVDGDFNKVLQANIDKLRQRYADKFTAEAAINRDTAAERDVLEGITNDGC